jgi:glycosyltransferase involved in cell wall biosynthesis
MTPENSRKKILLITRPIAPPWDEASKNFAYYLAKNVSGFDFGLLTNGILSGMPENIRQIAIYTANNFSYFQKIRLIKNLRKFKNDFDILHYIFTPTKQNTFLLNHFVNYKKNPNIKTIQTIATLREDLYSAKELKSLLFGDLIITYSDYAKNKLNALEMNNVKRVYPGIDLREYQKKEKDPDLMKKYNLANSDFIINFTGEYVRLGAIDDVIDSFVEIAKKIPEAKLSLAVRIKNDKDAQKKKEVVEKLRKNNLLEKSAFHDDGNYQMADIYNLCDVSLFPVREMKGKFDIPLAVVEAMACEKPVIISDLPILSELGKNDNSVIIEKGNVAQIVEAVLDLFNNAEKRVSIGREARKYAEDNFDIYKVAEEYRKIYGEL